MIRINYKTDSVALIKLAYNEHKPWALEAKIKISFKIKELEQELQDLEDALEYLNKPI